MKKQTIKVVWPDDYELDYPGETLFTLWNHLCDTIQFDPTDVDPLYFVLENKVKIQFNPYILHQCYDNGRISETQLLEGLEIKEENPKIKAAKRISGSMPQ